MITLFYLMACIFILHEIIKIGNAKEICEETNRIKEHDKSYRYYSSMMQSYAVIQMIYLIWALIGLTTSQMPIFLVFVLIGLIDKNKAWLMTLNGYIRIIILAFIIINKYQLHIDFIKLLIK